MNELKTLENREFGHTARSATSRFSFESSSLQHVLLTTSKEQYKSNRFDRSNTNQTGLIGAISLAMRSFLPLKSIAHGAILQYKNEQERLPRVLMRALQSMVLKNTQSYM
jgi:hypothetical protein